jgi:hypothetical protein
MDAGPPEHAAADRGEAASAAQLALLALLAALVALLAFGAARFLFRRRREGFASRRALEVHEKASEVFREKGGDARYSDYKRKVPGAEPVQFHDVRRLFLAGELTPGAVEEVL